MKKTWASVKAPSMVGVLLEILLVKRLSWSLKTFIAGLGACHLLNKFPQSELGMNPYCVEFLKVCLMRSVVIQEKYGYILW